MIKRLFSMKKLKLKKESPKASFQKPTLAEIEHFFVENEKTDLQKYTFTFSIKKQEK